MAEFVLDQVQPKIVPMVVTPDGNSLQPMQQPTVEPSVTIAADPGAVNTGISTQSVILLYDEGTGTFFNARAPSEQTNLLDLTPSTLTRTSAFQQNNGFSGVIIYLNVTAVGVGVITPIINAVESGSGLNFRTATFFDINAIGQYTLVAVPGAADDANLTTRSVSAGPLPRNWNFQVENLTGNSFTYEAGIHLVP